MTIAINGLLFFGIILAFYWFAALPYLERKLEIMVIPYYIVGILAAIVYGIYAIYRLIIWLPNYPIHINFT